MTPVRLPKPAVPVWDRHGGSTAPVQVRVRCLARGRLRRPAVPVSGRLAGSTVRIQELARYLAPSMVRGPLRRPVVPVSGRLAGSTVRTQVLMHCPAQGRLRRPAVPARGRLVGSMAGPSPHLKPVLVPARPAGSTAGQARLRKALATWDCLARSMARPGHLPRWALLAALLARPTGEPVAWSLAVPLGRAGSMAGPVVRAERWPAVPTEVRDPPAVRPRRRRVPPVVVSPGRPAAGRRSRSR